MKHELLVPAGDMESLNQAIANGADAIYLGCKLFGARKFAKNFDNDEIITAIKKAHLYGVKIYVTMNTLVKDSEVETFLNQVEFLYKNGADAILIQDFGMLCLIRQMYPELEIHASTQANTSSKETAELFYKLGVKRVVFSREMTLEEINSIDVPIEKEVFVHGALCISYSGCCLMSSMLGTRSGNRGECAGSCRLPYSLEKNNQLISANKYLLSTKELNASPQIKQLLNSNINSFKIEGRMKRPEYVGFITRYYRRLIDGTSSKEELDKLTDDLKTLFNREFTTGNLFSTSAKELMNQKTPNHIGLEIGKVVEINPTKIKIKLNKPLNQQDGIRFLKSNKGFIVNYLYDEKDNLINNATDICYVDNKINLKEKDIVCKTIDYKLNQELNILPTRKIPISFYVKAKLFEPLEITIDDNINKITLKGSNIEKSINAPITKDRIKQQLEKLGNTPFSCQNIMIEADDEIFISIKELNNIRRNLTEKLISIRTNTEKKIVKKEVFFAPEVIEPKQKITATVMTEEQLKTCLKLKFDRIYIENEELYEKYKEYEQVYYKIPRCSRMPSKYIKEKVLISDYFDIREKVQAISDYPLNITNIYSIYYLQKLNIKTVTLSVELSDYEITNMLKLYKEKFKYKPSVEVLIYGRVENMIIKGNILDLVESETNYRLTDFKKRKFPVYYDGTNTHVMNYLNQKTTDENILTEPINLKFNFYDEKSLEIINIVKQFQ